MARIGIGFECVTSGPEPEVDSEMYKPPHSNARRYVTCIVQSKGRKGIQEWVKTACGHTWTSPRRRYNPRTGVTDYLPARHWLDCHDQDDHPHTICLACWDQLRGWQRAPKSSKHGRQER